MRAVQDVRPRLRVLVGGPGHVLEDIIGKAEGLDMDAVRAEIAEQEQNG